jgi:hypothetical protein
MNNKESKHTKHARKLKVLALTKLETKGSVKNSAIETMKDLVVGVVGGGLAGAAVGKPSLLVGLGTSLIGHYAGSPIATSFGLGMMASGGYQIGTAAVNGTGLSGIEEAKERMKAFGENFKKQLYLDKIIKPKSAEEGANGLGKVQYFKYPSQKNLKDQPLDMSVLENIEQQIAESGKQYEQKLSGAYDELSGSDEKIY